MKREPKFKVGDIVTFRSREDMESEYGDTELIPYSFRRGMGHLCGQSFTVKDVVWDSFFGTYQIYLYENNDFNYSEPMFIDPIHSLNDDVVDTTDISHLN